MARTIEQIYNGIVAEKQIFNELNGLMPQYNLSPPANDNPFAQMLDEVNSYSKVSIWRLWAYLTATAIYTLERLWDAFRIETEQLAASSIAGNLPWYAAQIKAWQYGYSLIWNPATYRYFYADTIGTTAVAARLVAKVSINEVFAGGFNGVHIKVAKDSGGVMVPLDNNSGTEVDSLVSYVNRIKFAGVQTSVISIPADVVKLNLKIYYNGTLSLAPLQQHVEAAIKLYLKNIEFDGVLYLNELTDAIQAIPGIIEPWVYINGVECKPYNGAYTSVNEYYEPRSGYFMLQPVGNNPVNDSVIIYEPI